MAYKGLAEQQVKSTTREKQRTTYTNPKMLRSTKGTKRYIPLVNKEAAG